MLHSSTRSGQIQSYEVVDVTFCPRNDSILIFERGKISGSAYKVELPYPVLFCIPIAISALSEVAEGTSRILPTFYENRLKVLRLAQRLLWAQERDSCMLEFEAAEARFASGRLVSFGSTSSPC